MKQKTCHLIGSLERGGTEVSLVRLLPELAHHVDVMVVCLTRPGRISKELAEAGIEVRHLNTLGLWDPRLWIRLRQALRGQQPSLLFTYLIHADIAGRLMAVGTKADVVTVLRSSHRGRGYLRLVDRATSRLVRAYVVQHLVARTLWQRALRRSARDFFVIPNAIPIHNTFTSQALAGTPAVLCVSNLRPGKGHEELLIGFSLSQVRKKGAHLHLVGAGVIEPRLHRLAHELGIANVVHFHGRHKDVAPFLSGADVFIFPSQAESMSNALLEALAAGLPVIASDIPANQTVIIHEKTGLLFAKDRPQALARQLDRLWADNSLRQKVLKAGQQRVAAEFAVDKVVRDWVEMIRTLTII